MRVEVTSCCTDRYMNYKKGNTYNGGKTSIQKPHFSAGPVQVRFDSIDPPIWEMEAQRVSSWSSAANKHEGTAWCIQGKTIFQTIEYDRWNILKNGHTQAGTEIMPLPADPMKIKELKSRLKQWKRFRQTELEPFINFTPKTIHFVYRP